MPEIRSRFPRRLSRNDLRDTSNSTSDTQSPTAAHVGKRTPAHRSPTEKRIGALYAQVKTAETKLKDAEGAARYWSGVAFQVLQSLVQLAPEVAGEIHKRAFVAGCASLAESPALAEELCRTLGRLDQAASAHIYCNLAHGPAVLVDLVNDPARLEALIGSDPTSQAIELGKLLQDAAVRNQPLDRASARPAFTHGRA
jgi:hypothetical protein